jgi:hypothetical protein
MKKLICLACFVIFPVCLFAQETLTISTYYPSPYGSYGTLQLYPGDTHAFGDSCTVTEKGSMYYDDSASQMLVCDGFGWRVLGGQVFVRVSPSVSTTTSNTPVLIPGVSITRDFGQSPFVNITLKAVATITPVLGASMPTWGRLTLVIDGAFYDESYVSVYEDGPSSLVTLFCAWSGILNSGNHTIEARYSVQNSSSPMQVGMNAARLIITAY